MQNSDNESAPFKWKWLKLAPTVFIVGLLFFVSKAFVGNDWLLYIKKISINFVIGLCLLSIVNYLLRAFRWYLLCKSVGLNISVKATFYSYFSGFSMGVTPGKVGEIVRMWVLRRGEGIPLRKTFYPLFGDRVTDLIAIFVYASIGFCIFSNMLLPGLIAAIVIIILTIAWIFPNEFISKAYFILRGLKIRSLVLSKMFRVLKNETKNLDTTNNLFSIVFVSMIAWFMEGFGFWLLLKQFNIEMPIMIAMSIFSVSILVGALSMLPGGLGGAELTMISLLIFFNVDMALAVAITAITRGVTLWFAVVVGLIVLPFALKYKNGVNQ